MSWMGSMPKLTTTLKIPMTNYDSGPASVVRLSLILSKCARAMSSFDNRSCPSVGCRLRSYSSARIASRTSRSISCRQRRILRSSNVPPRSLLGPGARGALLGGEFQLGSVSTGTTSIMFLACLPKCMHKSGQSSFPHDDGTLSAIQLLLLSKKLPLHLSSHHMEKRRSPTQVNK
jgi:hypothetical protein